MADHAEQLKAMLQDVIHGRTEQASVTMHDYFVSKSREVAGLAPVEEPTTPDDDTDFDNTPNDNE
jgi:hypothetical protein